jgi:serine/threonine protein kinase
VAIPYGKYLLDRKLTEGGMAEIFLARPNPMLAPPELLARRSPIVVKRLFAHHSSEGEFVRMFFNEARLAARIKHPNIVDIFDQGESNGTYFLAMEYIHGEDLRGFAQQSDAVGKRPQLAITCRIIMDTLSGLHYAHTLIDEEGHPLGLVHRDVSPQNVLVTYDGDVKLIDFGIAKATRARNSEQTQAGMIKGKYAYMSPEQTRGEQLDARSDVFSAGTLLWELLTWRRLFKRATDLATLVAVTEEPAPSTLAISPDIPKELDEITLRALAPNRNDRWGSAKEFHDALAAFVRQQGWDASRDALGRYMKEIFAERLTAQARESAPSLIDDRASSGVPIGHRVPRLPGQSQPAPSGQGGASRPRAMTMPLQVINPALAQQARKAIVVPKSGSSLPGGPSPSSRSGNTRRAPPPPPPPDPASMPMRIVPDGSTALKSPSLPSIPPPPPRGGSQPVVASAASEARNEPRSEASTAGTSSTSRPPTEVESGDATTPQRMLKDGPLTQSSLSPARRRILMAVIVGLVLGALAVLLLQLFGRHVH